MNSKNIYFLPVDNENIQKIIINSPAHTGKFIGCIDYLIPTGKSIKAALDGEVVFIKDDSNIGGPNKEYFNDGNYITIKHKYNEYSLYEHLQHKSTIVNIGDQIKAGQTIALSGNTGYSIKPHLHFQVFHFTKQNPDPFEDFQCLTPKFNQP